MPSATQTPAAEGPWNPGLQSQIPAALLPLATIYRPDYVRTTLREARELADLTGLPMEDLVAFRPERLVVHELLALVTADFTVEDGRKTEDLGINFRRMTDALLTRHIAPQMPEIVAAYAELPAAGEGAVDVAVRSSATAEDLPAASFAGQQETYLNISGIGALLDACKRCFASLFTDRAISYRVDKGFDHFKVALSIGVQRMVRSDLACSGVMFTIDTESGFRDAVMISAKTGREAVFTLIETERDAEGDVIKYVFAPVFSTTIRNGGLSNCTTWSTHSSTSLRLTTTRRFGTGPPSVQAVRRNKTGLSHF